MDAAALHGAVGIEQPAAGFGAGRAPGAHCVLPSA